MLVPLMGPTSAVAGDPPVVAHYVDLSWRARTEAALEAGTGARVSRWLQVTRPVINGTACNATISGWTGASPTAATGNLPPLIAADPAQASHITHLSQAGDVPERIPPQHNDPLAASRPYVNGQAAQARQGMSTPSHPPHRRRQRLPCLDSCQPSEAPSIEVTVGQGEQPTHRSGDCQQLKSARGAPGHRRKRWWLPRTWDSPAAVDRQRPGGGRSLREFDSGPNRMFCGTGRVPVRIHKPLMFGRQGCLRYEKTPLIQRSSRLCSSHDRACQIVHKHAFMQHPLFGYRTSASGLRIWRRDSRAGRC
jgi:hypothetical protein